MIRVHVMPNDDLVVHDSSEDCVCGPDCEFISGGAVFVHHSLDGRERDERTGYDRATESGEPRLVVCPLGPDCVGHGPDCFAEDARRKAQK